MKPVMGNAQLWADQPTGWGPSHTAYGPLNPLMLMQSEAGPVAHEIVTGNAWALPPRLLSTSSYGPFGRTPGQLCLSPGYIPPQTTSSSSEVKPVAKSVFQVFIKVTGKCAASLQPEEKTPGSAPETSLQGMATRFHLPRPCPHFPRTCPFLSSRSTIQPFPELLTLLGTAATW